MRLCKPKTLLYFVAQFSILHLIGSGIYAGSAADIAGKWRSVKISKPADMKFDSAPKAWEIEFKEDGTFNERIDEGFGIAFRHAGTYQVADSTVWLKQTWRSEPLAMQMSLADNHLSITEPKVLKWTVEFERSSAPLAELDRLPEKPRTLEEAVATLRKIVTPENLDRIRGMKKDELIGLHHGFGTFIRNAFGLWRANKELLQSCGGADMHPDSASMVIIEALWTDLQQRPPYQ